MSNVFVRVWDAIRNPGKPAEDSTEELTETEEKARDLKRTAWVVGWVMLIGAFALILWSMALAKKEALFSANVLGLGLFLLGGAALVGGVLGLLFGIPKSVSDPAAVAPPTSHATTDNGTKEQTDERQRSNYSVNTNLEQISDWLTKIIVGVGLTELTSIRDQFYKIADYFGNGFGSCADCQHEAGRVGAAVIIIYGLAAGFLAGYLFTRMFLPGAFRRADTETAKLKQRLRDESELRQQLDTKYTEQQAAAEALRRVQAEIYAELYKYNEQGFRKAIEKLDELLKSEAHQKNPALFVYLAAAHGQAYSWVAEHETDLDKKNKELEEHRAKALQAVKNALSLGDSWKPILQVMWNPHHPVKSEGEAAYEDDLEPFYSENPEDEFRKLLGN